MTDANRYLPPGAATLLDDVMPRRRVVPAEPIFAWSLVLNGVAGLVILAPMVWQMGLAVSLVALLLPLTGVLSGAFALKGRRWGFVVGTLFYLVQCVQYYSPTARLWARCGMELSLSFRLAEGETLVVNVFAIFALVWGIAVLVMRRKAASETSAIDGE